MVRGWCDPTPTPAPNPAPNPDPDPEQVFATELAEEPTTILLSSTTPILLYYFQVFATELAEEPSAARGGEILSAALGTPTLTLPPTLTLTLT